MTAGVVPKLEISTPVGLLFTNCWIADYCAWNLEWMEIAAGAAQRSR